MMSSQDVGTPTLRHMKGRGALSNRDGRFERATHVDVDDGWFHEEEAASTQTRFLIDASRSVITYNTSPDVPFDRSINPYRGCEHGCIYCFARPTHTYLGFSAGLDFETRILYKPNAARLLTQELSSRAYACAPIALGVNTDAYQPAEEKFGLTRALLQTLSDCHHPVTIVTKSSLVVRDIDILASMARRGLVLVNISITTLDPQLKKIMEPRASAPSKRLRTLNELADAGIPVGVMVAPVIPAVNDAELERIVEQAAENGATHASYVLLRLPHELRDLVKEWLQLHFPLKVQHVLNMIESTRGGSLYDSTFGQRMRGTGSYAGMIQQRFDLICKRLRLNQERVQLRTDLFCKPARNGQLSLFGHDA